MSTTRDPTDLAGQEQDALYADALAAKARQKEVDDLKWLMAHAQGRRIVWRLLAHTGIYRSTFHTSGSVMSRQEGIREVGLFLLDEVENAAPGEFLKMLGERHK